MRITLKNLQKIYNPLGYQIEKTSGREYPYEWYREDIPQMVGLCKTLREVCVEIHEDIKYAHFTHAPR